MRHFLWKAFPVLLTCIAALSGCSGGTPDPAVSRAPYFSEVYNVHTLCTAGVKRVFPFETEADPSSSYLVLECSIQELLASSDVREDLQAEDEILVWVDITQIKGQAEALTELCLSADALIVNGKLRDVPFSPNSSDCDRFLSLLEKEPFADTEAEHENAASVLAFPPCLFPTLRYWGILPIREGVLDGASMESAMDGDVVFSLDTARPEEGLNFQNGDTFEDVCSALERYISEKTP